MGRVIAVQNRIGVLGGTFDPLHLGHLILAEEALFRLALDCVLFLLTPCPPHKTDQEITPLDHRLKMLKLAIRDQPAFEISRVDIDRSPPHYAADSLIRIREIYPQAKVFYLMGEDSLRDLIYWHEPGRFLQQCDGIGVMRRVIDSDSLVDLQRMFPGTEQKVIFLEAPRFDISSREIRQRVAQGLPFRYFLPQAVYQYILRTGLYCA